MTKKIEARVRVLPAKIPNARRVKTGAELTARQAEILELTLSGHSAKDIANNLPLIRALHETQATTPSSATISRVQTKLLLTLKLQSTTIWHRVLTGLKEKWLEIIKPQTKTQLKVEPTEGEQKVLAQLATGKAIKEIAASLNQKPKRIEDIVGHLRQKLRAANQTEMLFKALELKLIKISQ